MLATGLAALRVPLLPDEVAAERKPFVLEVGRVMRDLGARRAAEAKTGFEALVAKYPEHAPKSITCTGPTCWPANPTRV